MTLQQNAAHQRWQPAALWPQAALTHSPHQSRDLEADLVDSDLQVGQAALETISMCLPEALAEFTVQVGIPRTFSFPLDLSSRPFFAFLSAPLPLTISTSRARAPSTPYEKL